MQLLLWLAVGHTWTFVSRRKLFFLPPFNKNGIAGTHVESFMGGRKTAALSRLSWNTVVLDTTGNGINPRPNKQSASIVNTNMIPIFFN